MTDPDQPARPAPLALLVLLVAVGGAAGALGRYGLAQAWPGLRATLVTNVSGSFALGLLVGLRPHGRWSRPLLGTGVLGGFTTFSTFAVEAVRADRAVGLGYVVATLVGGVGAAALGLRLVR